MSAPTIRPDRRRLGERGQMGGAEVVPFGLLVFVIGGLLVANAWAVVDAKSATTVAAREAARAYVEAVDAGGAVAGAEAAARDAVDAIGLDPERVTAVELESEGFTRCARLTVTVTYEVPAISLPWIGGFGDGIDATSSHSEVVDPLRSGVPGVATCID